MPKQLFSGVSVCIFDAYGTLFDISGIMVSEAERLQGKAAALGELWRRKQLEYSWLRSLMGRHADFWHVTGEALDYAMAALAIDDPSLRARLMEHYLAPPIFADAAPALEALRVPDGPRLGVLSNGSVTMLTAAVSLSGLSPLFDAVLSVEAAGIFKPHPSAYRVAQDHFSCEPGAVAFITANGWDAAGAAAFGFRVAWVNRTGLPRDGLPGEPGAEVAGLGELPSLLLS